MDSIRICETNSNESDTQTQIRICFTNFRPGSKKKNIFFRIGQAQAHMDSIRICFTNSNESNRTGLV